MKIGVTGVSRKLNAIERDYLRGMVSALLITEAWSGGADGVDTEFVHAVRALHPDATVHLVLPTGAYHNTGLIPWADTVEYAPQKADTSSTYMARNDLLCDRVIGGRFIAVPETRGEVIRGGPSAGTWATIRRARKRSIPVMLRPLDEVHVI